MSVRVIAAGTITKVTGLSERPVFFVTLNNEAQPALVIKGENKKGDEADVKASVRWASKMMKNVTNPLVNYKPLAHDEWTRFKRFAILVFSPDSNQSRNIQNEDYTWIKMPFVANLSDADFVDADASTNSAKIKEVLKKFLSERVWRDLGKVVAVDLFNSNWDRFNVEERGSEIVVEWVNRSNVMFAGGTVIGLDPYFADAGGARGDANLNNVLGGKNAGLNILRDVSKRQPFALACTRAVAAELHQRMGAKKNNIRGEDIRPEMNHITIRTDNPDSPVLRINRDEVKKLFDPFVDDFLAGLTAGIDELKTYLLAKKRKYALLPPGLPGAPAKQIPPGVLVRMNYLKWQ